MIGLWEKRFFRFYLGNRCYTETDYAACMDTRKLVSGNLKVALGKLITWGSSLQRITIHYFAGAEYISSDTRACNLAWISNLATELHIPMKIITATLVIDDKPLLNYHDGIYIKNEASDLHILVDSREAFDIAN